MVLHTRVAFYLCIAYSLWAVIKYTIRDASSSACLQGIYYMCFMIHAPPR